MRKQRINAGQMRETVTRFEFSGGSLSEKGTLRARFTLKQQRCVYSRLGRGADETVELQLYDRYGISRRSILKIRGEYYAVSFAGEQDNDLYLTVLCGRCTVLRCSASSQVVEFDKDFHRAHSEKGAGIAFDGIFLERYYSAAGTALINTDTREYVLMVSKEVPLKLMDIIECKHGSFYVREIHEGEALNEAIIQKQGDV